MRSVAAVAGEDVPLRLDSVELVGSALDAVGTKVPQNQRIGRSRLLTSGGRTGFVKPPAAARQRRLQKVMCVRHARDIEGSGSRPTGWGRSRASISMTSTRRLRRFTVGLGTTWYSDPAPAARLGDRLSQRRAETRS